MKKSSKITVIVFIFFFIIASVIIARTLIGNHFKKKFSKLPPPGVIITYAKERNFENSINTFGTAVPVKTQAYKVEKFEIIKPINFNKKVKKGEIIVELKNRKIIAPFEGVIGKKEFSEDVEVSKSSLLINLDDSSVIYCDVQIPEIYFPFVKVGLPVKIEYSGSKQKMFDGVVDSISSRITEDTRSLPIRIKIDNQKGEILPGSFLEVSIRYNVRNNLGAPDTSTIVEGDNVFIYKVDGENKTIKTKVNIGDRFEGFIEIKNGLNSGDKIVAEGLKKVRPNLKIRPIEKGKKQEASSWGKKEKTNKNEATKGKFDWLKKLNIFKKSEVEQKS